MQKLKFLIPLALFIGAFFVACQEDDPFGDGTLADVTFVGRIISESGAGIEGALVKAGEESTLTDKNGAFRLKSVSLSAMHAMLTVSADGYFEMSRPYIVEDEALQTTTIQLLAKSYAGAVGASAGGVVDVQGGPKLTFPANAFVDENGNAFNGQAYVSARYIDPSDDQLGLFLPGDMTAENNNDEEVFLATYGMVAVEISTGGGQKLRIAPGKEVELRMPILPSQSATAPAEIPLWYYDLEEGHWKEEGSALRVGNEYVGTVQHFSFWNCDAPFPLTQLHGQVFLENANQPLANALVRITMLSTGASSFGQTDGKGHFGGCIPKDEALKLEVLVPESCGGQVYFTQNIGPFTGVTTIPDIIIPASSQIPLLKVSGSLRNCTGQPVDNGYVKVELGNPASTYYMFANAIGEFSYTAVRCSSINQTGNVTGYDLNNLLESTPVSISVPPDVVNLGNITVCNALAEYVRYTLDGGAQVVKVDPIGGLDVSTTLISTQDSSLVGINFSFQNSGQVGTFNLGSMFVNQLFASDLGTLSTTVSDYGNIGSPIIGTFGGNFKDGLGANHTISGDYRVIREW